MRRLVSILEIDSKTFVKSIRVESISASWSDGRFFFSSLSPDTHFLFTLDDGNEYMSNQIKDIITKETILGVVRVDTGFYAHPYLKMAYDFLDYISEVVKINPDSIERNSVLLHSSLNSCDYTIYDNNIVLLDYESLEILDLGQSLINNSILESLYSVLKEALLCNNIVFNNSTRLILRSDTHFHCYEVLFEPEFFMYIAKLRVLGG